MDSKVIYGFCLTDVTQKDKRVEPMLICYSDIVLRVRICIF